MIDLSGRRALVLGVSSPNSVGYRIAETIQLWGGTVAVTYRPRHAETGRKTALKLGCQLHYEVDACDETSMRVMFSDLAERWPRLDCLIHTYAYGPARALRRPVTELSRTDFHEALEVCVYSLLSAAAMARPQLAESDAPRIVTLTSEGDRFAIPNYHILGISKAALAAAVRYLAYELGSDGALCNGLRFSLVPSDGALRAIGPEAVTPALRLLRAGALTRTTTEIGQVAIMAALMASPAWQNITGEIITQDGGFAHNYLRSALLESGAQAEQP